MDSKLQAMTTKSNAVAVATGYNTPNGNMLYSTYTGHTQNKDRGGHSLLFLDVIAIWIFQKRRRRRRRRRSRKSRSRSRSRSMRRRSRKSRSRSRRRRRRSRSMQK